MKIFLHTLTKEQLLKVANETLRATSFLFLLHLCYTYISTTVGFVTGERTAEYIPFSLADLIWFLSDKVLIFSLYLSLFFYTKITNASQQFKREVFVILLFCIVRVAWQLTEIFNYKVADNEYVMFALTLCAVFSLPYLSLYRIVYIAFDYEE